MLRASCITAAILGLMLNFGSPAAAQEVQGPIRLIAPSDPPPDTPTIRIDARFAPNPDLCPARQPGNLHAAYGGTLEIGRRSDGRLYLVAELTFPQYLEGIAEVPRDWPIETLKAQVVAARTYAISHMNPSTALARELRYNLCATDACQVYRGLNVSNGAWGDQWKAAVAQTAGQILESGGRPASTFYFSTSNGRTYSNSDAFGGSPLPYLQPVEENDDGDSPLRRWSVRMPLVDLAETLRRAGVWGQGTIDSISHDGENVRLQGGGREVSMTVERLRVRVNAQAPCLIPKRYPTTSSVTGRPYPQVIPSKWLTLRQEGSDVVIDGEGWGHGVGMVQWGAKGKGDRGMPHDEILAFYYGGLRPTSRSEPGSIRVGLAINIEELLLEITDQVRVEGATFLTGPVKITGGSSMKVEAGPAIEPTLRVSNLEAPAELVTTSPHEFKFELSSPANVELIFESGESSKIFGPEPRDRGPRSMSADATQLAPGNYSVRLRAQDGVDSVESETRPVTVVAPSPSPRPTTAPPRAAPEDRKGASNGLVAVAIVALASATTVFVTLRARRRRATQR